MQEQNGHGRQAGHAAGMKNHYLRLSIMLMVSFIAMYILMYAMVDRFGNVYPNVNQIYMAGLMTAAMLVIELAVMGAMYPNRKRNALLIVVGVLALAACWIFTRRQTGVGDRQFAKSMIPHHAGAILMCNEAQLTDPDLQKLCRAIVAGQQQEIDLLAAKLRQLDQ